MGDGLSSQLIGDFRFDKAPPRRQEDIRGFVRGRRRRQKAVPEPPNSPSPFLPGD